jgi:thiol-disulfide isomerase/thioredoxin
MDPARGKKVLGAVAAVVVLAALGGVAWAFKLRADAGEARRDGKSFGVDRADVAAPSTAVQLADGSSYTLGRSTGELVFVNFWATWCPPCVEEMPSMLRLGQDLARAHPGRFRMVAVSVDEGWADVWKFFDGKLPPAATVALDPDMVATRAYYCAARGGCPESFKFPETYLVGPDGRLVAYIVGPRDWADPAARRVLERLIGG